DSIWVASTLEVSGARMQFFDVYWTTDNLSAGEVESWKKYAVASGDHVVSTLPTSFRDLPVVCPNCKSSVRARYYEGSWGQAGGISAFS
ncbi:unnamed protein product, partial [Sphagnum balticum]